MWQYFCRNPGWLVPAVPEGQGQAVGGQTSCEPKKAEGCQRPLFQKLGWGGVGLGVLAC